MPQKFQSPTYRLRRRGEIYYVSWTDPEAGRTKAVSTGTTDRRKAEVQRAQLMRLLSATTAEKPEAGAANKR
jgi:hypothetical protein